MKEQKRVYKIMQEPVDICRKNWIRLLPHYQELINQLVVVGLTEITAETLKDCIEFKCRKTLEILHEKAHTDASKLSTDPNVIKTLVGNPGERLIPVFKTVEMIHHVLQTSFLPNHLTPVFSYDYLTIENNVCKLTDETFEKIVAEFFTIFCETQQQIEIVDLVETALPALNGIFAQVRKREPWTRLQDVFFFNEEQKAFEFNPQILNMFK
jgi:hypothetical protein